ncbi:hypothetical protein NDU88_000639 [Pleurodeles waltl]|uniref:Uncharacterized protein n=1 Tax=Pleurodeles waltl TaxID=8319 RepID=A0AAV7TG45_PLEWA|nr:hypothetical protein NDU88_000639 [Pleurodeles waltl]
MIFSTEGVTSWKLPRLLELTTRFGRLTTGDGSHVCSGPTGSGCRGTAGGACGGASSGGACGNLCGIGVDGGLCGSGSFAGLCGIGAVGGLCGSGACGSLWGIGAGGGLCGIGAGGGLYGGGAGLSGGDAGGGLSDCGAGGGLRDFGAGGRLRDSVLVAVHVAVQVQVAVFSTVPVGVDVDRRSDTGPIVGATISSPDLPLIFWPFPTLDGGTAVLPLSPFVFPEPLVAGVFAFSLQDVGNFSTFAGGGMSLPSLCGTLAALMPGTLQKPAVAGTTVPGDVVAEVLGWDLESLALGDGRGGGVGKRSMLARKLFLHTMGWVDGVGLGVEEEVVFVGGVRLLNLGEGAWAGGCCEVDGCWVGVCLR